MLIATLFNMEHGEAISEFIEGGGGGGGGGGSFTPSPVTSR